MGDRSQLVLPPMMERRVPSFGDACAPDQTLGTGGEPVSAPRRRSDDSQFRVISLHGSLTSDPELESTTTGTSLANLRVAVQRPMRTGKDAGDSVVFKDPTIRTTAVRVLLTWATQSNAILPAEMKALFTPGNRPQPPEPHRSRAFAPPRGGRAARPVRPARRSLPNRG